MQGDSIIPIAMDISHTVPNLNSRIGGVYEVPQRVFCRTLDCFGMPKGASWHESINSVILRLQQTGHDQKFYYRYVEGICYN